MEKYITVINKRAKHSVPFRIEKNGEIIILSDDPRDTELNCIVSLGNIFYEHSKDFRKGV